MNDLSLSDRIDVLRYERDSALTNLMRIEKRHAMALGLMMLRRDDPFAMAWFEAEREIADARARLNGLLVQIRELEAEQTAGRAEAAASEDICA